MEMQAILWLVAMVAFIIFEIATMGLYTIWFAGGSLVAFFVALIGLNGWVQIGVCIVVSAVLIFFTRPIVKQKFDKSKVKTNAEGLIGKSAIVIEKVDNVAGTGRAVINGQEWMARAIKADDVFDVNAVVVIEEISGVKLLVKKVEEQ